MALILSQDKVLPTGPHESKTFDGHCHCRRIQFTVTLPTEVLPLRSRICHCSACRYTHGTFVSCVVTLPPGVQPEWAKHSSKDKLAGYTKPGGRGPRLFCPDCGSHVGYFDPSIGQWTVAWGLFDETFWQLTYHAYPKSAPGGGLVDWLPKIAENDVQHLITPDDIPPAQPELEIGPNGEERLRAECACGGVKFTIQRPSQEVIDDDYMGMYVSPKDQKKWKAFLDLCRDCSRLSGDTPTSWMLVPRIAIQPELPLDFKMGTLKTYKSSESNTRGFCGVCAASVFALTTRRVPSERQAVLAVAMGILRAPEGVRAENWATWRSGNIAWAKDAQSYDAAFTGELVEKHGKWGQEEFGEALDFPII